MTLSFLLILAFGFEATVSLREQQVSSSPGYRTNRLQDMISTLVPQRLVPQSYGPHGQGGTGRGRRDAFATSGIRFHVEYVDLQLDSTQETVLRTTINATIAFLHRALDG